MDPTACLERALRAMDEENRAEAVDALRELAHWLDRGGFYPLLRMATNNAGLCDHEEG